MISDQLRSRAKDLADIERDANRDHHRLADLVLVASAIKALAEQVAELERHCVPIECRRLPDSPPGSNVVPIGWRSRP
jgi:hypothetical protein